MTALPVTALEMKRHGRIWSGGDARPVARKWLWFWFFVVALAYGLLWSRNWYPLSDSSLYLSMGRSFSLGRGLTMMGDPVRLVPPLTPMFLGTLMKLGAGIGGIQAAMICLMLLSHVLGFLTLRRWANERVALGAMLACALSYWVFANAFTIMSEPLCVALMWGGFLALSHVNIHSRYRWWFVVTACLLLLLAAANRDAVLCLLPGPLFGVVVRARRGGKWAREAVGWALLFAVVFGSWFFHRYPPQFLIGMFTPKSKMYATTQSTTAPVTAESKHPAVMVNPEFDADPETKVREGRYQAGWLGGVRRDWQHMLTEPPVLGGRWVCEGMAMASVRVFEGKEAVSKVVGTTVALLALTLTILGGLNTFLRGRFWLLSCAFKKISFRRRWRILGRHSAWWVLGPALYFTFIWLQWGTRVKPRYMVPIAPVLCLFLWSGLTWVLLLVGRLIKERSWNVASVGRIVMSVLVVLVVLGNAFPWAMEFYIRHVTKQEFYDVARRGAYAELVDIGAYAQQHIGKDQAIWMNAGAHRRIAYFLTGHKIDPSELIIRNWKDWNLLVEQNKRAAPTMGPATNPLLHPISGRRKHLTYAQRRRRFFAGINHDDRYLIIMVAHPAKGESWPGWHWPAGAKDRELEWWRLYERQPDDTWKLIKVPRSREYVKSIPGAAS
jgi:hypothetical protein